MKIEALHVGLKVKHPIYGEGVVKTIGSHTAEIDFLGEIKTISPEPSGLEPAEPRATLTGLDVPLKQVIDEVTQSILDKLGFEKPDAVVDQLGARWHNGRAVLHPADPSLSTKEVPLETFFHKVVLIRNNLRVLEQKVNSHEKLTDGEKVELQQYITRCYGSLTTFNILFRNKEDQFGS